MNNAEIIDIRFPDPFPNDTDDVTLSISESHLVHPSMQFDQYNMFSVNIMRGHNLMVLVLLVINERYLFFIDKHLTTWCCICAFLIKT